MDNFNKEFKIKALIGRGSIGEVHKASCMSKYGAGKISVAVKIFDSLESIRSLKEQFKILLLLDHNNVVRYLDLFINHRPMMVMEYVDCGSLYNYLESQRIWNWHTKGQDFDIRINWMCQCAKGLAYLHSQNIIYYELNSKELLLTNNYKSLKICGIENINAKDFRNSSSEQERKNDFLKKEMFVFGLILLQIVLKRNYPALLSNTMFKDTGLVRLLIRDIKNYANNTHLITLIAKCTINVVAKDDLPTMEEMDFNLCWINRTHCLKYIKQIGRGSSGKVHKAKTADGAGNMTVAVKEFDNLENHGRLMELNILLSLQHESIVRYFDLFINDDRPIMVMEYADCGSLYDYLDGKRYRKSQDVDIRINWMRQCAKGLTYLHSQNIIYNELNSKELLLFNNYKTLKICGIETLSAYELLNSSEEQEKKNNLLRKELFYFGIILLEVMSNENNLFPQKENILEASEIVLQLIGNIKNYTNIIHIKKLIENCTKNMAANDCLQRMEEVEFILGINRTGDLKYIKKVGTGSFGQVYQSKLVSEDGTTNIVAAKEIYGMHKFKEIHREMKMLSSVKHTNIVSFLGLTVKDGNPVLLMKYAEHGSLYDKLHVHQNKNDLPKLKWMLQCAKGLAYLHKENVMHRDLKTKNLVLTNVLLTLKICDFGLIKYVESQNTAGIGTYGYMAPEVSQGGKYTTKCDVYSFGIVLWEIMSQKKPFYELEEINVFAKQGKINEGYRPKVEDAKDYVHFDDIKTIMEKCWSQDVENRPTMKEVIDYIQLQYLDMIRNTGRFKSVV